MNLNCLFITLLLQLTSIACSERSTENEKVNTNSSDEAIDVQFVYNNSDLAYKFSRNFPYSALEISRKDDFISVHNFQQNSSGDAPFFWAANGYTQTVELYDFDFNKVSSFGEKGPGPMEFSQAHIIYWEENRLLVHDFQQTAVKEINTATGSVSFHKLRDYFYSAAFLPEDKVLVRYTGGNPVSRLDFDVVDFNSGDTQEKIQIPVGAADHISKVYEGDFRQNHSLAAYFNYSVGMLFIIDRAANKFVKKIATIDNTPPPRAGFKQLGGGARVLVNEPSYQMFKDGFLDNDDMFWLLNDITDEKNARVVDVYLLTEISGKEYQFSISIPNLKDGQKAAKIFKGGNNLIVYYDDQTIVNYEISI